MNREPRYSLGLYSSHEDSSVDRDSGGSGRSDKFGKSTASSDDGNMMSLRTWLVLLLIYVVYLLGGGVIFWYLENPDACRKQEESDDLGRDLRRQVANFSLGLTPVDGTWRQDQFLRLILTVERVLGDGSRLNLTEAANVTSLGDLRQEEEGVDCFTWNYYNSVFFCFTAVTTIGYGHLSPATDAGKAVCIVYSLFGVPINGILIGGLASFFADKLQRLSGRKKRRNDRSEWRRLLSAAKEWFIYLIPGTVVFLCLPAVVFIFTEDDWSYLDSFYFAFITLTTIGFGDLVAARYESVLDDMSDFWSVTYRIFLYVWIVFGLGYTLMLVGVIADNLKKPAKSAARRFRRKEKAITTKIVQEIVDMKTAAAAAAQGDDLANGEAALVADVRTRTGSDPQLTSNGPDEPSVAVEESAAVRRARSLEVIPVPDVVEDEVMAEATVEVEGAGDVQREAFARGRLVSQLMDEYYQEQDSQVTDVDDDSDSGDEAEELNHDTITSLRNLIETSRVFASLQQKQRSTPAVNSVAAAPPSGVKATPSRFLSVDERSTAAASSSAAPSSQSSITSVDVPPAFQHPNPPPLSRTVSLQQPGASSRWAAVVRQKVISNPSVAGGGGANGGLQRKFSLGQRSTASSASAVQYQQLSPSLRPTTTEPLSVPDILRNTTLEEFVAAAEKVMRDEKAARQEAKEAAAAAPSGSLSVPEGLSSRLRKISSPAAFHSMFGSNSSRSRRNSGEEERRSIDSNS